MSSNRFRIQTFFRQFTFLTKVRTGKESVFSHQKCEHPGCVEGAMHDHPTFISPSATEEVTVMRVSPDLLAQRAWTKSASGSRVDICDRTRFFLLNQQGELLAEVQDSLDILHHEAHTDNVYWEAETVGEALLRLSNPDEVYYIMCLHTGYRIKNHESVGGYAVTLYKPRQGFSLNNWVAKQMELEQARLAGTIAEIDAEA